MEVKLQHRFGSECVVGLGYTGLPTAAVLASRGVQQATLRRRKGPRRGPWSKQTRDRLTGPRLQSERGRLAQKPLREDCPEAFRRRGLAHSHGGPYVDALLTELQLGGHVQPATLEEAVSSADLIVVLADHRQYRELPKNMIENKCVIDMRDLWLRLCESISADAI